MTLAAQMSTQGVHVLSHPPALTQLGILGPGPSSRPCRACTDSPACGGRFIREGGLDLVLQLLPQPELQYFAMSALVVLLGSPASAVYEDGPAGAALARVVRGGLLDALLPLLCPGNAWVIQGRCCGVLTHLLKLEQRAQVSDRRS